MPFPASEREVYENNPLQEVICQLAFPPILKIDAEPPSEFQDRVRQRYPLYERESPAGLLPPHLSHLLASLPMLRIEEQYVHKFLTEDRARFISLSRGFVALTESRYARWELFRTEMAGVEESFRAIYEPSFYARIGLRYRDVIDRDGIGLGDVAWSELLNPALAGPLLAAELADEVDGLNGQLLLRPEGVPGAVRIVHGLAQTASDAGRRKQLYIIDSDFFAEGKIEANVAFARLDEFNRHAGYLFRWAITPRLRDALGVAKQ